MSTPAPSGWWPRRGEVYLVRLDKLRPALILSSDILNRHSLDVCVVPITSIQHREFSLRVPLPAGEGGLDSDSWAKCDQVTTQEKSRLAYPPLGRLSASALRKIEGYVKAALQLP
jgi:mRNA interferase MazF